MNIASHKDQSSPSKHAHEPRLTLPAMFLAWALPSHTRRSELMACKLGIPLRRVHVLKREPYLAPLRYAIQALLTPVILFRERPKVVFVQNPPIFAPLFAWIYCALTWSNLIIDSHTDALQSSVWEWSLPLHRFLSRRAKATVVTNAHLAQIIQDWGAKCQIIIDVPSEFPAGKPYPLEHPFNIAMVSSYAPDEPLGEVVQVAKSLPDVGFYVTGDLTWGSKRLPTNPPSNLHLTGFLPDDEYYGLLRSVQAVMALTTEDHTLQYGACEAVWLGQPIITSYWPLLRDIFHKGTIHVDNTAKGIRAGVLEMRTKYQQLASEVLILQEERRQQWREIVAQLEALLLPVSGDHQTKKSSDKV